MDDETPGREPAPVDLSGLDPTRDARAFEHTVRAITQDAMAARRAHAGAASPIAGEARPVRAVHAGSEPADNTLLWPLLGWRRPILAAAALVVVITVPTLWLVRMPPAAPNVLDAPSAKPATVAQALGIPNALARWILQDRIPTPAELVGSLNTPGDWTSRQP